MLFSARQGDCDTTMYIVISTLPTDETLDTDIAFLLHLVLDPTERQRYIKRTRLPSRPLQNAALAYLPSRINIKKKTSATRTSYGKLKLSGFSQMKPTVLDAITAPLYQHLLPPPTSHSYFHYTAASTVQHSHRAHQPQRSKTATAAKIQLSNQSESDGATRSKSTIATTGTTTVSANETFNHPVEKIPPRFRTLFLFVVLFLLCRSGPSAENSGHAYSSQFSIHRLFYVRPPARD